MNCVDVRVIDNKDSANIRVLSCLKLTLPVIFLLAFMLPGLSQYGGTSFEHSGGEKGFLRTADSNKTHSSVIKSRRWIVAGGHAVTWAGTFMALNNAWYRDYPRSGFHFFDDR
ncbi:MAG TPA: hypothetical protein VK625_20830, partial [Flavitalea sp.]|nr:hypothetical protein [Flavitalea sp.]